METVHSTHEDGERIKSRMRSCIHMSEFKKETRICEAGYSDIPTLSRPTMSLVGLGPSILISNHYPIPALATLPSRHTPHVTSRHGPSPTASAFQSKLLRRYWHGGTPKSPRLRGRIAGIRQHAERGQEPTSEFERTTPQYRQQACVLLRARSSRAMYIVSVWGLQCGHDERWIGGIPCRHLGDIIGSNLQPTYPPLNPPRTKRKEKKKKKRQTTKRRLPPSCID